MGDHRFDCEITFRFHDKTYKFGPCWLNYASGEVDGLDDRILTFFRDAYEDGMARYAAACRAEESERNKARIECRERDELARLKAKYPERLS